MSSNLSSFFGQWCVNINLKPPAMKFYSVTLKVTVKVMSSAIVYLGLIRSSVICREYVLYFFRTSNSDKNVLGLAEFQKIATATAIGFAIMGFIGFFVKLIHIPINNIIVGWKITCSYVLHKRLKNGRGGRLIVTENNNLNIVFYIIIVLFSFIST